MKEFDELRDIDDNDRLVERQQIETKATNVESVDRSDATNFTFEEVAKVDGWSWSELRDQLSAIDSQDDAPMSEGSGESVKEQNEPDGSGETLRTVERLDTREKELADRMSELEYRRQELEHRADVFEPIYEKQIGETARVHVNMQTGEFSVARPTEGKSSQEETQQELSSETSIPDVAQAHRHQSAT